MEAVTLRKSTSPIAVCKMVEYTHIWIGDSFRFIFSLYVGLSEFKLNNFRSCYLSESSIALHFC